MKQLLEDDDEVVRDGESVKVSMNMMDGVQRAVAAHFDARDHRPGYVRVSSAAIEDARAAARDARQTWIRGLQDAWKRTPARDAGPEPDAAGALLKRHLGSEPDEDDAQARRDRQWAEYCDRVSNAWRNPSGLTDLGAAPTIERRRQRYTSR